MLNAFDVLQHGHIETGLVPTGKCHKRGQKKDIWLATHFYSSEMDAKLSPCVDVHLRYSPEKNQQLKAIGQFNKNIRPMCVPPRKADFCTICTVEFPPLVQFIL